jgi:hypothetical protein
MLSAPVRSDAQVQVCWKVVGKLAIGYFGNASARWALSAIITVWMPKMRFSHACTKTRVSRLTGPRFSRPPSAC